MPPRKRRHKPRPAPPPAQWSEHLYLRMKPADLARMKFLLEGYDNLGYLTIVDKYAAVARFVFSPHFRQEALTFLDHVAKLVPHEIVALPGTP